MYEATLTQAPGADLAREQADHQAVVEPHTVRSAGVSHQGQLCGQAL